MEPVQPPPIDLILSPSEVSGRCQVCERNPTDIRCDSCDPSHFLCRECIRGHREDFNRVLG